MKPRLSRLGLLFALLGLLAQLAVGGFVPSSADLFAMGSLPICQGNVGGESGPAAPAKHRPDFAPSPFCTALFASAEQLPAAPALPVPAMFAALRPELPPPATAPPSGFRLAAQPRGPPVFLT